MKTLTYFFPLVLFIACQSPDTIDTKDVSLRVDNKEQITAPGVVPGDIGLDAIAMNLKSTWNDYNNFYTNVVLSSKEKHYFSSLQWMTISFMVLNSNFHEAPDEIKLFYLVEALNRDFINNPEIMLRMFESISLLSEKEIAKAAFDIHTKNEKHLKNNTEYRISHHAKYKDAYVSIAGLAFNRWGVPKYQL